MTIDPPSAGIVTSAGPATTPSPTAGDATAMHVLVIAHHEGTRNALAAFASARGHLVNACRDAAETHAAIERESYPLILVEAAVPGEHGFSLIRWLRARAAEDV